MFRRYLKIHPEVEEALETNKPVVALESTLIAHGMPYPKNIQTARQLENLIREHGAIPATVAILQGDLKVGLDEEDLECIARAEDVGKASRRDIPYIVAKRLNGATTVASTMIIAALAGIKVFVTGGIGGVHREGENTLDISADLTELARTNVAVVCAGAKSILDIGLTLEYLETKGVPVIGFQTSEFPAFYTQRSGFYADYSVSTVDELAKILQTKWDLGLEGGVVVANPIPEDYEMEEEVINEVIEEAIQEAKQQGVTGKRLTPFMLSKIKTLTGGESLESNIALVRNNAILGAKLAVSLLK